MVKMGKRWCINKVQEDVSSLQEQYWSLKRRREEFMQPINQIDIELQNVEAKWNVLMDEIRAMHLYCDLNHKEHLLNSNPNFKCLFGVTDPLPNIHCFARNCTFIRKIPPNSKKCPVCGGIMGFRPDLVNCLIVPQIKDNGYICTKCGFNMLICDHTGWKI